MWWRSERVTAECHLLAAHTVCPRHWLNTALYSSQAKCPQAKHKGQKGPTNTPFSAWPNSLLPPSPFFNLFYSHFFFYFPLQAENCFPTSQLSSFGAHLIELPVQSCSLWSAQIALFLHVLPLAIFSLSLSLFFAPKAATKVGCQVTCNFQQRQSVGAPTWPSCFGSAFAHLGPNFGWLSGRSSRERESDRQTVPSVWDCSKEALREAGRSNRSSWQWATNLNWI